MKRVPIHAEARNGVSNGTSNGTANGTKNGATNGVMNGAHKKVPQVEVAAESGMASAINKTLMPILLIPFCPNLILLLWYTAVHCDGSFLELGHRLMDQGVISGISNIWLSVNFGSTVITSIIFGYMLFALILMIVLPGPRAEGPVTPKGNVPVYKDNGFYCYLATVVAFAVLTVLLKQRGLTPTVVYDRFDEFLVTMTIISMIFCAFLQFKGYFFPSTTDCGSTGNFLFDYYWGTELYPRIFGIDVKVFTNCRFGMTVWPVLCLLFAVKSYELYGFVDSMWVSCFLQMAYFTKFFWWEAGYMRTIDIMVDRAGFYICWGCLVYVPGLYASVSLYLVNHPVHLGPVLSAVLLVSGLLAIAINYWADHQKQVVRNTNGQCTIWGKAPEMIRAKYHLESGEARESLLLVSGFWGVGRHFHYVPELLLALCWTLPAGLVNILPYSYFIFLFILLVHRTFRDDVKCGAKYTTYWKEYCKRVPYKMIPGIF